jgi:hypothetical protein
MGHWQHKVGRDFSEGFFVLVVNTLAHTMCGYCSGRDARGALIFDPWILAKKDGLSPRKIIERLREGERALREQTITAPPEKTLK